MLWSKPFVAGLLLAGTGILFGIWIIINNLYVMSKDSFSDTDNTPHQALILYSSRLLQVAAWALSTIIGLVAYSNTQKNSTSAFAALIGAWTIAWAALNVNFRFTFELIENRDAGEVTSLRDRWCNGAGATSSECDHVRAVGGLSALLLVAMAVYLIYVIFNWIHIAFMGAAENANPEPKVEDRKIGRYLTYFASVLVVGGYFIRQVGLTKVTKDMVTGELNLWDYLVITGKDVEVYQTIGVTAAVVAAYHFFAPAAHYHANRMSNKALWSISFAASSYALMTSIPATIYDSRSLTTKDIFSPISYPTVCDGNQSCEYYRLIVSGEWLVVFAVGIIWFALIFSAIKATPFAAAEQSDAPQEGMLSKVYSGLLLFCMVGVVAVWAVTVFIASVTADGDVVLVGQPSARLFSASLIGKGIFGYTYTAWLVFLVHFLLWVYYLQSSRTGTVVIASFLGQLACLATWVAWVYVNMYNFSTTNSGFTTVHKLVCPEHNESFSVDDNNLVCYLASGTAVWSCLQGFAQILMTAQLILPFFSSILKIRDQKLHFLQWLLLLSSIATVIGLIIGAVPLFKIAPSSQHPVVGLSDSLLGGDFNVYAITWGFGVVAVVSAAALAFAGTDTDASGRWVSIAESANWGAALAFWSAFPILAYAVKNRIGTTGNAPCDGADGLDRLCDEFGGVSTGFGIVAISTGLSAILISFMRFTRVNNISASQSNLNATA